MFPSGQNSNPGASTRWAAPVTGQGRNSAAADPTGERFTVVRLQHLSAATAAALVKELYKGKAGFEGVTADTETNSLVLRGSDAIVKKVKATIEKLDADKEEPPAGNRN